MAWAKWSPFVNKLWRVESDKLSLYHVVGTEPEKHISFVQLKSGGEDITQSVMIN